MAQNGLIVPGNIDVSQIVPVRNPDGGMSTVYSTSFGTDQGEVLVPRVVNGKVVSEAEALNEYRKTGRHLGIFDTPENATAYAEALHQSEAKRIEPKKMSTIDPIALDRQRQMAQLLLQQSNQPLQQPNIPGARISPWEGISKLAQGVMGNLQAQKVDKQTTQYMHQQDNARLSRALMGVQSVAPELDANATYGIAQALASADPVENKFGESALQDVLVRRRESDTRTAEMERLKQAQGFSHDEHQLDLGQSDTHFNANLGWEQEKANRPQPFVGAPGSFVGTTAPQTGVTDITGQLPATPAAPRNIDPLSPEGIAAQQKLQQAKPDNEPLIAIMGKDGKSVLVPRSQAVGQTPASNREQGRPVPAAQAIDIADINGALGSLEELKKELSKIGATGNWAKAGAMVPNFVTDWTGLGTEAKQKQAVIDKIKQMIGKTLEGGVLRKEDESKYEKILPTIADTAAVVATKIDGLHTTLMAKQQNSINALEDAGFEVSQFRARAGATGVAPQSARPRASDGKGNFVEWDGTSWVPAPK